MASTYYQYYLLLKSIKVISVQKQLESHMWPPNSRDAVTIELAEITKPEHMISLSIEHQSLKMVVKALEYLHPASPSIDGSQLR